MGLHGPQSRISWIRNELSATASITPTQIQPTVRWGMVPFGAANCAMPSTKAAIAAMAWSTIAGGASSSGARVMGAAHQMHSADPAGYMRGPALELPGVSGRDV